jgi:hypothetical protein
MEEQRAEAPIKGEQPKKNQRRDGKVRLTVFISPELRDEIHRLPISGRGSGVSCFVEKAIKQCLPELQRKLAIFEDRVSEPAEPQAAIGFRVED